MKILFLADEKRFDQPVLFGNLAGAAKLCGDTVEISYDRNYACTTAREKFDAVCCWGWRRAQWFRDKGMDVLVAERGYMGDRFKWYSLGWNGLNGRAKFPIGNASRWEQYHWSAGMCEWQSYAPHRGTRYAVVMGQVPSDTAVKGIQFLVWARGAIVTMRQRGYVAHYRAHPRAPNSRPVGVPLLGGELAAALAGAAVAVTYNSNSGVDAVLAGVPVIACDPGSMVYRVAAKGLNEPLVTPDRMQWAHDIAWSQWLIEETALKSTWLKLKSVVNIKE